MQRARFRAGGYFEQAAGYARAARHGSTIVVSGTGALGPDGKVLFAGDSYAQARHALEHALAAVVELGGSREDVVRTRILLAPGADPQGPIDAHREIFGGLDPANTTYYTGGLLPADALVEVEIEAILVSPGAGDELADASADGESPARAGSAGEGSPDVTARRLEELEFFHHGAFGRLRAALGIRAFGMQVVRLEPDSDVYPEHDHTDNGHEEVYVTLSGSAVLIVGTRRYRLEPGVFVRVGPEETRKVVTEADSVVLVVVGAAPGRAYTPPPYTNEGAALAVASASPASVRAGGHVTFDGSESTPGKGAESLSYAWDFEGTGQFVETGVEATHTYETPGTYSAVLRVTDSRGRTDSDRVRIDVRD
jgi:enamine deaminase RidA (YjgF/YER057c/UK114 family)/mannose-6-phosphate isomerase-like protein (cupin superfamily)